MTIAVDFDGTIVEHRYPAIGKGMLFACATMKELQKQGHQLILWTYRAGHELDEAVQFCRERGVEFWAVNKNYPEEVYDDSISRKIIADVYIDDRNIGGFVSWSTVWQMLNRDGDEMRMKEEKYSKDSGLFSKISGLFKSKE